MKKLIDYEPKELEHNLYWASFYKITSYVMFVVIIILAFFWHVAESKEAYYIDQIYKRDSINIINQHNYTIGYNERGYTFSSFGCVMACVAIACSLCYVANEVRMSEQ